jgi:hypothetical protein
MKIILRVVAFGVASLHESDGQLMLPCRGFEFDFSQASVNGFDRRIQQLIDRLVIGFASDIGSIKLLAVKQRDHRVFEFHARNFTGQRHVADSEFVFAIRRKIMFHHETAARAERHSFNMVLLPALARSARRRQGNHHVGHVTIGGRYRRRLHIAHRLKRNSARSINVLVYEVWRNLQSCCVIVEIAFDVVGWEQCLGIDVQSQ